jgi:outer membrane protein assembly factor BamB
MSTAEKRRPFLPLLLAVLALTAGSLVCAVTTSPAPTDAAGSPFVDSQDATPVVTQTNPVAVDAPHEAPPPRSESQVELKGDELKGDELTGNWPQWGGSSIRNNVPVGHGIPTDWDVGQFDRATGEWIPGSGKKMKWVSRVGSQTYGNPVVVDGQVYVGTNNGAGYLPRYPSTTDLGCLLAFDTENGQFLWQHSSQKLPTGRVHDWPLQGICCAPLVEGQRLWFVTSRGEVVCLDTQGYYDGQDDGPEQAGSANLFTGSPSATNGLDDGTLSAALSAFLAANGISTEGRVRINGTADEGWTMRVKTKEKETHYRMEADGDLLAIFVLQSADDTSEGIAVCKAPIELTAGLDEGEPNALLLALLKQRGAAIENSTAEKQGAGWTIEGSIDGTPRMINIMRRGPNLVANIQTTVNDIQEADEIWTYDMMADLNVSQHNMCSCSVTASGDILFVNTSNGVDESHINIPSVEAPSFIALDKNTGKLLWSDASPGANILHGQWSSPAAAELNGVPQVIFGGGDGWVYSFRADRGREGAAELLWKFDANPKTSQWILGGRGTRNNIIGTPVILHDRVYIAVGQDPEHGEGVGHLWCLDPSQRGDISRQLAVHVDDRSKPIPHRRLQAVIEEDGEVAIDNPNSGVIWHYSTFDQDGDGLIDFEETMHRSCGTVAIKNGLLFIADFSGLFHCLDADSGKVHWTYDLLSAAWGSPMIVEDKVYIGDEDGEVTVFSLTAEPHEPIGEIDMRNSVYSTPVISDNVMYISNKTHLFAIPADESK